MATRKAVDPFSDEELAIFVVHLKMRPADYFELTLRQREAIISEWNASQKKR